MDLCCINAAISKFFPPQMTHHWKFSAYGSNECNYFYFILTIDCNDAKPATFPTRSHVLSTVQVVMHEAVPFGYNRTYKHQISDVKVEFRLPRISIKNVNQDKIENHYSKLSDMCKSLLLIRSFIASRSVCFLNKVR